MAQTLLLQNARLIDGLTDQPRERVSILVTGERITAVEQEPLPPPASAQATKGKMSLMQSLDQMSLQQHGRNDHVDRRSGERADPSLGSTIEVRSV